MCHLSAVLVAGKATCSKAGQPITRKAVAGARRRGVGCPGAHGEDCGGQRGWFALRCAFLLEICSWSWRGLWARVAVPTGNKRVPETVKRALDQESGDLGLIFVPPMTHFVASWLSPDSTQTARVPVPALVLTSGIPEPATPPSRPDFPCLQNGGDRGPHLPGVC